jgi:hypothetical protein
MKRWLLCLALAAVSGSRLAAETYTWINAGGGAWSLADNWLPHGVPGAGDSAVIAAPGAYTVAVDGSASAMDVMVGSPAGGPGPILAVPGSLAAGVVTIHSNAFLTLGGVLSVSDRLSVAGTFRWQSGRLAGSLTRIEAAGELRIETGNDHDMPGHSLTNLGTVRWTGGRIRGGSAAVIHNAGVWRTSADSVIVDDYGGFP